ncbi:hypothetical protein C4J87_1064 [Pseudomonas sp. R1-43-08]|uniref:dermonecrotic toxin domain-containing protein n=1 Tax=Pseudomonas sp. R1-43-08 TaxID=1173270 RepID=UPI000F588F3D|nr:DUF6543 domain-containing protein [Pseudomonas sp. R1-43-08]AZF41239.1 hypothetical protein C4J87_1064 [Pseudomonas sp. R1-43-08]
MHTSLPSSPARQGDDPQPIQAKYTPLVTFQPVTWPVVPPASSTEDQQEHLIGELAKLNVQTNDLIQAQPGLGRVYQHKLTEAFPHSPRPINPNQIFYSRYREDQEGQRQLLSSEPLGSLLTRLRATDGGTYLTQQSGAFYREPNTLDADKHLSSNGTAAQLAGSTEIAVIQSLNAFWDTAEDDQPDPEEQLIALRRQVLAHQLALRTVDGTLSAAGRTLADNVLKYPTAAAREKAFAIDDRPAVYRLMLEDGSEFAAAFILNATGKTPPTGSVMLYSPGEAFEEYENLDRLNQAVAARIREGGPAGKRLLASLSKTARAGLPGLPVLAASPPTIEADIVAHCVRSVRIRQYFAVREALRKETLPVAGELDLAADTTQYLDITDAFATRNLRLIEVREPEWLKTADVHDQARYRQLEQAMSDSNAALMPFLEKVQTLETFSLEHTDKVLKQLKPAYADVDIAPYKSLVRLRLSSSLSVELTGYRDENTSVVYITADEKINIPRFLQGQTLTRGTWKSRVVIDLRTLGSYAQRNVDPWSAHDFHRTISATATLVDTDGNTKGALGDSDLRALAQEADIGGKYAEYLRSTFSQGSEGNSFATAWQRANAAKMHKDALESRLNPDVHKLFIFKTPGSGLDWIKAVVEYPDSTERPRVSASEIDVNLLVMGGALDEGRGGQVINGVLIIQRKGTTPGGVCVLYTPDAPDEAPFRELANGLRELDALKAKPQWRAYFSARMATNDAHERSRIFSDTRGVHRYALTTITGNFHAYLYLVQLGFQLAHAAFRSRSNAQISRESTVNAFMFGIEVADLFIGLVPGKAAQTFVRRGIEKGLGLTRQLGRRMPGLVRKIGTHHRARIAVTKASIRPLEPAWVDVAAYRLPQPIDAFFDVEEFAQANHYTLWRTSGNAPCFFDKHNNQLIAMRDEGGRYHLFQSFVEDGARYVKDPAGNSANFMVVPGDAKSWKPRFERTTAGGGTVMGMLRGLTPEQQVDADLIAALGIYSTDEQLRYFEPLIKEMTEPQKRTLLANARQQMGNIDEATFRRKISGQRNLSPRAKNELRDALLRLHSETDIYVHINRSTSNLVPPLLPLDKDKLFKKIKRLIGKNDNFSKEIRASIRIQDPDTNAQFVGYAITPKQMKSLDKFDENYKLSTWSSDSLKAFLNEKGRQQTLTRIATDNKITREEALESLLSNPEVQKSLTLFRTIKFKEKLKELGVVSYAEDFKKSGIPYVAMSRGTYKSGESGVRMIDSVAVTDFEKNLPRFSASLEFDAPRVPIKKIEKPSPAPTPSPAPPTARDPAVNIVKQDELLEAQSPLLSESARNKLEQITQDIQAGRVSRKKIGNYTYTDLPQIEAGAGRGRWRVAIERTAKEDGKDVFVLRGIFDYHDTRSVAWGM